MQKEKLTFAGQYVAQAFDKDGNLKWEDTIENLVTTQGKNDMLDKYLEGSAYTAAFFVGLISDDTFSAIVVGDTAASHTGWREGNTYSEGVRQTPGWDAASGGAKAINAGTPAAFSINGSITVRGAFLASNNTKTYTTNGGAADVLFSAGLFTAGDKVLGNGDTLNVMYTLTAT